MKAEDEAAIYLEECGINGDAMLDIHEDHVDDYEEMKGSIYVADLMAGFAESKLQALKEEIENEMIIEEPESDEDRWTNFVIEGVVEIITNLEDNG